MTGVPSPSLSLDEIRAEIESLWWITLRFRGEKVRLKQEGKPRPRHVRELARLNEHLTDILYPKNVKKGNK